MHLSLSLSLFSALEMDGAWGRTQKLTHASARPMKKPRSCGPPVPYRVRMVGSYPHLKGGLVGVLSANPETPCIRNRYSLTPYVCTRCTLHAARRTPHAAVHTYRSPGRRAVERSTTTTAQLRIVGYYGVMGNREYRL